MAKWRYGPYIVRDGVQSSWIKIKNAHYSQIIGRDKKFERLERPHEPQQAGWASCAAAVADQL